MRRRYCRDVQKPACVLGRSQSAKCYTIDLTDEGYSQLIVEVADPEAAVNLIRGATCNSPG